MTKDEILQALRLTANGFAGHPVQDQLAEKLAKLLSEHACTHCRMPEGEHMRFCPNNPKPLEDQDVVGMRDGKAVRRKKAD